MHSYRILTKRRIHQLLRGYMRYQSELIHVQSAPGTGEVHAVHHTLGYIVFYHGIMKIAGDTANISSSGVHVQRATEIKADASHCECGLRSTSLHRTEITSSQNTGETTTSLPAPLTHCDGRTQGTVSDKQPLRAPELTHTPTQSSRPSRFPDLRLASRHDSVNCEISGRNRPSHAVLPAGYLSSFAIALLIAVSPLRRAEHWGRERSRGCP